MIALNNEYCIVLGYLRNTLTDAVMWLMMVGSLVQFGHACKWADYVIMLQTTYIAMYS